MAMYTGVVAPSQQAPYAASVQGAVMRVSALDSHGKIIPSRVYTTDAFLRVQFTPEYEDGQELTERNASGAFCVRFKEPNRLKWTNLELAICDPDPELTQLISGGTLIYDPADGTLVIGWAAPAESAMGSAYEPPHVAIEIWSYAVVGDRKDTDYPYYWWLFPDAQLSPSDDRVIENGLLANTFTGTSVGNPNFGVGPDKSNPWPAPDQTGTSYSYARCTSAYVPAVRGWWTNELTLAAGRQTLLQLDGYIPVSEKVTGSVKVKGVDKDDTSANPPTETRAVGDVLIMVYKNGTLMGDVEITTLSTPDDQKGNYTIAGLGPGSYQIKVYESDEDLLKEITDLQADLTTSGESVSFVLPYYGETPTDPPKEQPKTVNFLYTRASGINVVVDVLGTPVDSVTVKLLDENKALIKTAVTQTQTTPFQGATVYAKFENLKNIAYYVEVDETDSSLIKVVQEKGASLDTAGLSPKIDMSSEALAGTTVLQNISYVRALEITGTIGVENLGVGKVMWVEGATVKLEKKEKREIKINNVTETVEEWVLYRTAVTDKEGKFTIKDLGADGDYKIYPNTEGGLENPLVLAIRGAGASTSKALPQLFTITAGQTADTTFDFLYTKASTLSGRITVTAKELVDGTETDVVRGLPNAMVRLLIEQIGTSGPGILSFAGKTAYSDADGNFKFTDIPLKGKYAVEVDETPSLVGIIGNTTYKGAAVTAGRYPILPPSGSGEAAIEIDGVSPYTGANINYVGSADMVATLDFSGLGTTSVDLQDIVGALYLAPVSATTPNVEPTNYSLYTGTGGTIVIRGAEIPGSPGSYETTVTGTSASGTVTVENVKSADSWFKVELKERVGIVTPQGVSGASLRGTKIQYLVNAPNPETLVQVNMVHGTVNPKDLAETEKATRRRRS